VTRRRSWAFRYAKACRKSFCAVPATRTPAQPHAAVFQRAQLRPHTVARVFATRPDHAAVRIEAKRREYSRREPGWRGRAESDRAGRDVHTVPHSKKGPLRPIRSGRRFSDRGRGHAHLRRSFESIELGSWIGYRVDLTAAARWQEVCSRTGASGTRASAAEIPRVLGDLDSLRIRCEFIGGSNPGRLDEVTLSAVPPPAAVWSVAGGPGSLGGVA
jgi:hypothetical protein